MSHILESGGMSAMTTDRKQSILRKHLINRLRKLNIFPRIFLLFCIFLIVSTGFITILNQISYTNEIEKNQIQKLSTLAQRDSLVLNQEKVRLENSMEQFLGNTQILNALEECRLLSMSAASGDAEMQAKIDQNQNIIGTALASISKHTKGICALVFVNSEDLYTRNVAPGTVGTVSVHDLDALLESEIYTGAVEASGYPFWRDSTGDTTALFYDSPESVLGITGCITLSYEVYAPKVKQPLGVLICCIYPEYFAQVISEYSVQKGSNTYIVGENGMVEGIAAGLSAPPYPANASELLHTVFTQQDGIVQMESPKGDMLVSFYGDPKFPVHVANLTYRSYIMEPIYRLRRINFTVMFIVIAIGAVGFYLVAVSIADPVQRLIRTMKHVGSGDFTAVYQAESNDEIGMLCDEFERMVADMLNLLDRAHISETKQKELELAQKSAQLDALQMQVNPHFLYNTLDMIRWECMYENGGESPASDMIEKFCTLLRMTIKGDNQKETIADSILHAETYLEVVNFRHTHKIELETDLNFDPKCYLIPCLSIQPILENAVRHGFSGENTENRNIRLVGRVEQNDLKLTIADNGVGMTQEQLTELREHLESAKGSKDSIGLRNVNQRCRLCYGEHYGIQIDSRLSEGTTVVLSIPADPAEERRGRDV